jgi:hypothetical protein
MHQTKKGNQWYFGMKAHIGVDSKTKIVHTVTATPANVHDILAALGTSWRDEEYLDAARQLRAGIGVGESIDQFLMKRRNNRHVRDLGSGLID